MNILKKTLKYLLIATIIGINATVLLRIFIFSYYPSSMKHFLWNDTVASALESDTDNEVLTYNPPTAYDSAKHSNFFCDHVMIVPKAGQLQISVRANKSLMPKIAQVYELNNTPKYFDVVFDFSLLDNEGNRYPLSFKKQDSAFMYYYERLVFDEIPFDETDKLFLEVYVGDEPDYSEDPLTSLYVYDAQVPTQTYKLSRSERNG